MKQKSIFTIIICLFMVVTMLGTTVTLAETTKATNESAPSAPTSVKVVKKSKTSLKISWSKVKEASGYTVYKYNPKSKKFKKVKTLKAKKQSFVNKKLKSNKTYKYKVRAFKKINGKKKYSPFSYLVSAKTVTKKSKSANVKKVDVDFTNRYLGLNKISDVQTYLNAPKGKKLISKKLRWKSSNPSIVKVKKGGYIQAMGKPGTAKVYITAHNGVRKVLKVKVADYANPSSFTKMDKVKKMDPKFASSIVKYKDSMCRVVAYMEKYKSAIVFKEYKGDLVIGGKNLNIDPIEKDLESLVLDAKMTIWVGDGNVEFNAPGGNSPSVTYSDYNGKSNVSEKYMVRMATGWICYNGNV